MDNKTVKEMKAMAKERGLKRYSALRRAELVSLLTAPTPAAPRRSLRPDIGIPILDDNVPDIDVPILQLTQAPSFFTKPLRAIKNKFNEWTTWFRRYIIHQPRSPFVKFILYCS